LSCDGTLHGIKRLIGDIIGIPFRDHIRYFSDLEPFDEPADFILKRLRIFFWFFRNWGRFFFLILQHPQDLLQWSYPFHPQRSGLWEPDLKPRRQSGSHHSC